MADFYTGYFVLPSGTIPGEAIELAQPTGGFVERSTQSAVMVDVLDEDGNPSGEQKFSHWMIGGEDGTSTETVEVLRGGWTRIEEVDGDIAMIVLSTGDVLDQMAGLDDVLEIDRHDADEGAGSAEAVVPMAAVRTSGEPEKPEKRTKKSKVNAAKMAKIKAKLEKKRMLPVPPGLEVSSDVIEHVYGQFRNGWEIGTDAIS